MATMTPAQAIAAAKPGAVLIFAADEPLGAVKLGAKQTGVTVRGGVAESLLIYGAGHRFEGLRVEQAELGDATKTACIRVVAQGIAFDGLMASGSLDTEGSPNGYGLVLDSRSADITIINSKITDFWSALVIAKNDDVRVDNCELGRTRRSPLLGSPGNDNRFTRLMLHTVLPKNYGGDGDHGNFVGLWTDGQDVRDFLLDTVTCEQRDGHPVMGISMYCKGDRSGWWVRPTLRDIVVISQHTQGLTLSQSRGALLERIASFATRDPRGLPKPPREQFAPRAFLKGAEALTMRDMWMQRAE
jgi:hypothetical protein